ncbi:MAG: glycerate kinase type-2 family protein [Candidatus Saccharicenans sp.]
MDLKELARRISQEVLRAVKPVRLIEENVKREGKYLWVGGERIDLDDYEGISMISIGKAGGALYESFWPLIKDRLKEAVATGVDKFEVKNNAILIPAAHPLPDKWSLEAGKKAYQLALSLSEKDLLLVLISGGGSSHLCYPEFGLELEAKREVIELLLKAGADIKELNTVRKHLSRIKGGRLAKAAWPAKVVNLIISDVIGNDLENIASAPTWCDSSTFAQALEVLARKGISEICPASALKILLEGAKGRREETVKKGDKILGKVSSFIIGDNLKALYAAKQEARNYGLETIILTSEDNGQAREAAEKYIQQLSTFIQKVREKKRAFCLLGGGELVVKVKGKGRGGRNTEFVLACLIEIIKQRQKFSDFDWLIMSLATDGVDGPTDSAGAWISSEIISQVERKGLEPEKYLENNDSYSFFKEVGGILYTGPTGTNVMDVRLFLLAPRK